MHWCAAADIRASRVTASPARPRVPAAFYAERILVPRAPRWAEDSLGDRFFSGTFLDRARSAPCLANAARVYQRLPNGVLAKSNGDTD